MELLPTTSSATANLPLQAWAARTGIGREVDSLLGVLEETKLILAVAREKTELQNKALDGFIKELEYEMFDADVLVDELKYCRIQAEVMAQAEEDSDVRQPQVR